MNRQTTLAQPHRDRAGRRRRTSPSGSPDSRLRQAVKQAVAEAAALLPALMGCCGRIRFAGGDLEVWAVQQPRPGYGRPDQRTAVLAGGVTLNDLLTGLAAHGVHSSTNRFPDQIHPICWRESSSTRGPPPER